MFHKLVRLSVNVDLIFNNFCKGESTSRCVWNSLKAWCGGEEPPNTKQSYGDTNSEPAPLGNWPRPVRYVGKMATVAVSFHVAIVTSWVVNQLINSCTCALNSFNTHLSANQKRVFPQFMVQIQIFKNNIANANANQHTL